MMSSLIGSIMKYMENNWYRKSLEVTKTAKVSSFLSFLADHIKSIEDWFRSGRSVWGYSLPEDFEYVREDDGSWTVRAGDWDIVVKEPDIDHAKDLAATRLKFFINEHT